jgi:arabinan endo-1,5-alpha-L-arabinosidase
MVVRSIRLALGLAALAAVASLSTPVRAATSGANGTHDPSRIVESNGKFYFCGTGGGCAQSEDGLVWKQTGLRIPIPSWSTTYTDVGSYSGNQGIWAPDIIFYKDKYYIYYSFCARPAAHAPCVVGLYTTPTLDSTASNFRLTDAGKVVNNPTNAGVYQYSTIDPAPALDATGNLWSAWGSGYGKDTSKQQIYVTRMTDAGLPFADDPGYKPPEVQGYGLQTGGIEGSYIHYHAGYYYLFWNSGGCCSGTSSTYTVHIARSQTISGPYTGSKVWYSSNGDIHGPGHVGIYSACGVERFTFHYYPNNGSILGENELTWGADGWPVPGAPSSKPLVPCGNNGGAGAGGGSGGTAQGGTSGSGGAAPISGGPGGSGGTTSDGVAGEPGVAGGAIAGGAPQAGAGPGTSGAASAGAPMASAGAGTMTAADPGTDAGCSYSLASRADDPYRSLRMLVVAGSVLFACLRRKRAR